MTNIATALKNEIIRISKKELKTEIALLRKANIKYRSEIAALKKRTHDLEVLVKNVVKTLERAPSVETPQVEKQVRFSAKGFKSAREKMDVSAKVLGDILGVTGQTIYSWESGKTRPNSEQIEMIAALKKMGKRKIHEKLAAG